MSRTAFSPSLLLTWHVRTYFPPARVQQWKSWTSYTDFRSWISLNNSFVSISIGDVSKIIWTHSLKIGQVVKRTRTENANVQMGSTTNHVGWTNKTIEAQMTPRLWIISPMMWRMAALTFIWLFYFSFSFSSAAASPAAALSLSVGYTFITLVTMAASTLSFSWALPADYVSYFTILISPIGTSPSMSFSSTEPFGSLGFFESLSCLGW